MGGYYRRVVTDLEVDTLFGWHREAFQHHIEQLWGLWNDDWQRDNFRRECAESSCEVLVRGETLLGYVQYLHEPGCLRIWNIVIGSQFRGQGLGSQIIRELQQLARNRDVDLALRVFPTNLVALRFYERRGFREISRSATGIELTWRTNRAGP
jgi:ribosomal protein S18 acetylase RimI-like enzyme